MKKIFITLALSFLFFFLFLPNTYALEVPCNSEDDSECVGIRFMGLYYSDNSYVSSYTPFLAFSDVGPFDRAYDIDGTVKPSYITYLTNQNGSYFFKYDLNSDIVYNFNLDFYSDSSILSSEKLEDLPFSFSAMYKGSSLSDSDYYQLKSVTVKEDTDVDNFPSDIKDMINGPNHYNFTTHTVLTIKISFSTSIDSFQFSLGDVYNNISDMNSDQVLLKYSNYEATSINKSYFYYTGFNITTSEDEPGGDYINFDTPTSEDEAIFETLDKCDSLDIGCHVSNLGKMINNLFVRIGNFFQSSFRVFQQFFEASINFFNMFLTVVLDGVDGAFKKLQEFLNYEDTGLTSVITSPLVYIKNLTNRNPGDCPIVYIPIRNWFNHSITLPCPTEIYSRFGIFFTIYQAITTGIIAYWCLINILSFTLQFKEPFSDKIEVMDL